MKHSSCIIKSNLHGRHQNGREGDEKGEGERRGHWEEKEGMHAIRTSFCLFL